MAAVLEAKPAVDPCSVFGTGEFAVTSITETSAIFSSLTPLTIFTPTTPGSYPVILFLHGFCCDVSFYSDLLTLIASHGYVIAAPQLYVMPLTSEMQEIESASQAITWLATGLGPLLPDKVEADVSKLNVVGHSRGGKTAFALALGNASPSLPFSAVIGLDPVAGTKFFVPEPHILDTESFNITAPITVIGTGLGCERKNIFSSPCAPAGYNHVQFFEKSKPTCAHFVTVDYGHMDVLNDDTPGLEGAVVSSMCKCGRGPKSLMRSCCSGLVVASLKAYLDDDKFYLDAINADPAIAPTKLDNVEVIYKSS